MTKSINVLSSLKSAHLTSKESLSTICHSDFENYLISQMSTKTVCFRIHHCLSWKCEDTGARTGQSCPCNPAQQRQCQHWKCEPKPPITLGRQRPGRGLSLTPSGSHITSTGLIHSNKGMHTLPCSASTAHNSFLSLAVSIRA